MLRLAIGCCLLGSFASTQDSDRRKPDLSKEADRAVKLLEIADKADAARIELLRIGKPSIPLLLKALDDPRSEVRIQVVRTLGLMGQLAKPTLQKLDVFAKSKDRAMRYWVFDARRRLSASGTTLIADYSDNRIVEVDKDGKETFKIEKIFGVWDVERLPNGNLLICEFSINRVREVTRRGKTVWKFEGLKNPFDADALPNGNVLIADTFGHRVIEVNRARKIVWEYGTGVRPYDVDRLPNGNTLIADCGACRVLEVDEDRETVWELTKLADGEALGMVYDADRLPNGNTLLTIRKLNQVLEVDRKGKVVMRIDGLRSPSDADRLPNGHTLVAENGAVREFDKDGKVVRTTRITWAVEANRY